MQKPMILAAIAVIALIGVGAAWLVLKPAPKIALSEAMLNIDGADIGGPFTLVNQDGVETTHKTLVTKPSLMYFGYTFCPDICPIDVQNIADAVEMLAEQGTDVQPVFITVDPERDTAEELKDYADAMHPRMVALTGTQAQIDAAREVYKVYAQRVNVPDSEAEYLMQHTGFIYLETPGQGLTAMFRQGTGPEQLTKDIARILDAL